MNTPSLNLEESMRQGFKYFNRFMILMWRLGLGKFINIWPAVIGQIMVVTHTGQNPAPSEETVKLCLDRRKSLLHCRLWTRRGLVP